jgi:hypothetical protein
VQSFVISPAPWEPEWIEHVAGAHFDALGLPSTAGMEEAMANKFFAVRGSELWTRYQPSLDPHARVSVFG